MEPLRILVAEDNAGDALLLERAFSKAGVNVPIHFVHDGQEVVDYLEGGSTPDNPQIHQLPTLLLLDLQMPRLSGFEVLMWLRRNALAQPGKSRPWRVLSIIYTASTRPEDIQRAYALGANSYLVKPLDFNGLVRMAEAMNNYWLRQNTPPE